MAAAVAAAVTATPAMAAAGTKLHRSQSLSPFPSLKFPSFSSPTPLPLLSSHRDLLHVPLSSSSSSSPEIPTTTFHGPCFVLGDNIDTDQIIPAEHLTLVPSNPDEYHKLGSLALCGLSTSLYPTPFVLPGADSSGYSIIIAGANFGCGSSREHAPVAIGASGTRAVVAESYARIFFRNSVATGEVYPLETETVGLWRECTTGDVVTVDLDGGRLINHTTGKEYKLKPIGDAGPVIEAGGIFAYARKTGMISGASIA